MNADHAFAFTNTMSIQVRVVLHIVYFLYVNISNLTAYLRYIGAIAICSCKCNKICFAADKERCES